VNEQHRAGAKVRLALGVVELLVAAALVAAAFWCWHQGVRTSNFLPYTKGVDVQAVTYYSAPWISGAVGCVVLAGLLAVDTVRRVAARSQSCSTASE